ncbi:MAG: VTT domain-containing protein [Myxococcaceae bacterium]|jgi:phospholipase D1/2|nr:VTT domain-containing protein [Myxococcaceae bacterium]
MVFLVLGVAAAVAARLWFGEGFEPRNLLVTLRSAGGGTAAVGLWVALYVVASSALLPAAGLHVVAGAMWGFGSAAWRAWLMANLMGHLHFALGRFVGRARVRELLLRRRWTAAVEELEQSGVLTVLVLRQTPVPFVVTNLVCGASPITWPQFLVGHAVGVLPNVLISTWFAAAIAEGVEGAQQQALRDAVLAAAGVIGVALASRLAMGLVRRRRAAQRTTPT